MNSQTPAQRPITMLALDHFTHNLSHHESRQSQTATSVPHSATYRVTCTLCNDPQPAIVVGTHSSWLKARGDSQQYAVEHAFEMRHRRQHHSVSTRAKSESSQGDDQKM